MNIFELFAKISLDTKGYEEGLAKAGNLMSSTATALGNAAKIGMAAVTTAATTTATTLIKGTSDLAAYGDGIDKMSQKLGMSAQAYQEWDAIMQHSGASIDTMQAGMKTLANAVETGNEAFGRLGITQEQIAGMNQEQLFSATITALQNVGNETERTYLASQLLGRGATELGALLNTSAKDTEAMRQRVHELGGVMSDEAVKSAAAFQDQLQDMKTAISGTARGITSEFLPAFTDFMSGVTELFSGNEAEGSDMITKGLDRIITNIQKALPKIIKMAQKIGSSIVKTILKTLPELIKSGTGIVESLIDGVVQSLPALMDSGVQILSALVEGMYTVLPMLVNAGLQIILTLAQYLTDNMPTLAPKAVDMIITIIDAILDSNTLSLLLDAALGIIMALADYLLKPETINKLVQKVPEIVEKIVTGLVNNVSKLLKAAVEIIKALYDYLTDWDNLVTIFEAGKDIIGAVISGIGAVTYELLSAVVEIAEKVADKFGIGEYWEAGVQVINDFMQGVRDQFPFLADLVDGIAGFINDSLMLDEGEFVKPERPDLSGITEDAASRIAGIKAQAQLERAANRVTGGIESFWDAQTSKGHAGTSHRRARGGIVRHPELALVGEAGAEAIMPLENNTEWIDMLAKRIGGGSTINVTLNVEGGIASDYDVDRLVDRLAETIDRKLGERNVAANRAVGGVSW